MNNLLIKFFQKLTGKIDIETRKGLMQLTTVVVLLEGVLFAHLFIIPYTFFGDWKDYSIYIILPIIFYILKILLFGSDDLYYGDPQKNKYASAFQKSLPSKYIEKKFNIDSNRASAIWFEKCFNPLKDPKHPRHEQRKRTLSRGFTCRFIYYFIKTMEYIILLSISVLVLQEIAPILSFKFLNWSLEFLKLDVGLTGRIVFIVSNIFLLLITKKRNNPDVNNITGVWKRFDEINNLHINWIDETYNSLDDFKTN